MNAMRRSVSGMVQAACVGLLLLPGVAVAQTTADAPVRVHRATTHIGRGTRLTVRVNETLESGKTAEGQTWNGTLVHDVVRNGRVILPAGAPVSGVVTESKDSGRIHAPGILSLRLTSVRNTAVATDVITRDGEGHTKSNVTKVGGGAAGGAVIGGLAGGGKGAGIGALVGAGAGGVGAMLTGKRQAKVAPETTLTFTTR